MNMPRFSLLWVYGVIAALIVGFRRIEAGDDEIAQQFPRMAVFDAAFDFDGLADRRLLRIAGEGRNRDAPRGSRHPVGIFFVARVHGYVVHLKEGTPLLIGNRGGLDGAGFVELR